MLVPWLAGCANWPTLGTPLDRVDPAHGYRLGATDRPRHVDDLRVIASFSGGGMRAAALAHGALRELAATPLGDGRSLLDELDVVSGVSGGAVVAAYFALDRQRYFREFEPRFLHRNVARELWWAMLNPLTLLRLASHRYARGDLYAEHLDRRLFEGARFGELARAPDAPFVILNATDLGVGARFEFTQDLFDAICLDLEPFPLARAVAASAAAPPAVTPLALRNDAGRCGYRLPDWAQAGAGPATDPQLRRTLRSRELQAWQRPDRYPWLQLADGSIADDLGLRALTDALLAFESRAAADPRPIVLITVDAAADTGAQLAHSRRAPGEMDTARRATQVSFERYSTESRLLLRRELERLAAQRGPGAAQRIYVIEVDPHRIEDPAERDAVMSAPTQLALPRPLATRLIEAGARLLRESADLRRLRRDLEAPAAH